MRVLLACDKFKGSLGAAEACDAIRAGLEPVCRYDLALLRLMNCEWRIAGRESRIPGRA